MPKETKYHSIPQVAAMFNTTSGQINLYIKKAGIKPLKKTGIGNKKSAVVVLTDTQIET